MEEKVKVNTALAEQEDAAGKEAEPQSPEMVFVLYTQDSDDPVVFELTDVQCLVAVRSIFRDCGDGRAVMYSDEELLQSMDKDRPLNHFLLSVDQAAEMLQRKGVCGAVLYFHPGTDKQERIPLQSLTQTAVLAARLGINLEKGSYVNNEALYVIYGYEWEPSYSKAAPVAAEGEKRLPYTRRNLMKGIRTPFEIKALLDETIIGQDKVKEKLATAVYEQEIAARYNALHKGEKGFVPMRRKNILLYGPSGSGKTAILNKLSEILGRPVVIFDATTLTPAGYHGNSAVTPLYELLAKAGGDVEKASHGIIYLDEWDKAFCGANGCADMSAFKGAACSYELLRMMDGCDVTLHVGDDEVTLNTGNILFIVGGAFPNLDAIVLERMGGGDEASGIGFLSSAQEPKADCMAAAVPDATQEDLKRYGIPVEVLGRIRTICRLKALDRDDLVNILARSDRSPLREYSRLFGIHRISLEVPVEAMEAIADRALEKKLGARGLSSILDEVLSPVMFRVAGNRKRLSLRLRPECFTAGASPVVERCTAK